MKKYIELKLYCIDEERAEIATAYLADYPFESFESEPSNEGHLLRGYILAEAWESCREEARAAVAEYCSTLAEREIEDANWNAQWETENLDRVEIDDIMVIRAPHGEAPPADSSIIDIVVAPQMSFGSGHHHTTRLMCRLIHNRAGRGAVLDVGCGTGVLSVAALKCGAETADAIDIDPWSVESTRRAAELNGLTERIRPILGTVEAIEGSRYEMVAANIMRNIIVADMARYAAAMLPKATLLLSGFLEEDYAAVEATAIEHGLSPEEILTEEGWVAAAFVKA